MLIIWFIFFNSVIKYKSAYRFYFVNKSKSCMTKFWVCFNIFYCKKFSSLFFPLIGWCLFWVIFDFPIK